MSNDSISNNGVNETGTMCEGTSPGRCLMAQQHEPGRHQPAARRTTRRKWSQEENRIVIKCYSESVPSRKGLQEKNAGGMATERDVLCHITTASRPSKPDPQEKVVKRFRNGRNTKRGGGRRISRS